MQRRALYLVAHEGNFTTVGTENVLQGKMEAMVRERKKVSKGKFASDLPLNPWSLYKMFNVISELTVITH